MSMALMFATRRLQRARLPMLLLLAALLAACGSAPPAASTAGPRYASIQLSRVWAKPTPATVAATDAHGRPIHLQPMLTIPGAQVRDVQVELNPDSGMPRVTIRISEAAGERVLGLTRSIVGNRLAMQANGHILQIATVSGVFSTSFAIHVETMQQAARIHRQLLAPTPAPDSGR